MPPRSNKPKRDDRPADLRDATRGPRLHKLLADLGVGSRRTCEQVIAEGRVHVNGVKVDFSPAWVDPVNDRVEVDGVRVNTPRQRHTGHTYLMVNKSRGVICTSADPEGRRTILDLVPHPQRLFCVGRLDAESTGLVLLTDDGELANALTHPRFEVAKSYEVLISGTLDETDLGKLERGVMLSDRRRSGARRAQAASIEIVRRDRERTRLRVTLTEGRNREIRRMLARLGYKVRRLNRTALGPLRLKGVARGEWRALTRDEVRALRQAASRKSESRKSKSETNPKSK